jgi:replicative DNA helicase
MNIEHQIIGCLFDKPELAKTMQVRLDHFDGFCEREMFKNLVDLIGEGLTPDAVLLAERIEQRSGQNMLPEIADLLGGAWSLGNATAYQDSLIRRYRHSQQVKVAGEFYRASQAGDEAALNELMAAMKTMDQPLVQYKSLRELMPQVIAEIDDIHNGEGPTGVMTGITKLDHKTGGLQPTDLVIIAARTSVGKTAFMMNIAANLGDTAGGVVSGEQASNQIVQRVLANKSQVSAQDMRTGGLDAEGFQSMVNAGLSMMDRPLYIADISRPSIDQVEATARQMHYEQGIKILFVDYLQLIKNSAYPDRRLQVDDISKRLKGLALDLHIPVVCLAQLNRDAVDRMPRISDLKESGAIEEDADQVILLSRDDDERQIWVDVQKNRNGEVGSFPCGWDAKSMRVVNI